MLCINIGSRIIHLPTNTELRRNEIMCSSIDYNDVTTRIQEVKEILETVSCSDYWEESKRDEIYDVLREVGRDADNHFNFIDTGEDPDVFFAILDDAQNDAERLVGDTMFNVDNLCYAAKNLPSVVMEKGTEITTMVADGASTVLKTTGNFIAENKTAVKAGISVGIAGGVAAKMIHDDEADGYEIVAASAAAGLGTFCVLSAVNKFFTGEW